MINGKNHGTLKYTTSSTIQDTNGRLQKKEKRNDTLQTLHWPRPLYPVPFPKIEDTSICSMSTVKYILLNSDSFRLTHPKYYLTSNLKGLFKNTKTRKHLEFFQMNQLFHQNLTKFNKTYNKNPYPKQ